MVVGRSQVVGGEVCERGEDGRSGDGERGGTDHDDGHHLAAVPVTSGEADGAEVAGQRHEDQRRRAEEHPELTADGEVERDGDQCRVDDAALSRPHLDPEADDRRGGADDHADDRPRQDAGDERGHRRVPAHRGGAEPGDPGDDDADQHHVDAGVARRV